MVWGLVWGGGSGIVICLVLLLSGFHSGTVAVLGLFDLLLVEDYIFYWNSFSSVDYLAL